MLPTASDRFAALLTLSEVGLGSFLHAFHVPLAGHFLSLNQGVLLVFASRSPEAHPAKVSLIASLLKSLSPAGKRLTPMLAISAQGALFSIGLFAGRNSLGIAIGMALLSVWAFAQPLLLAHLIFGKELWDALLKIWTDFAQFLSVPVEWGVKALLAIVAIKATLAVALGLVAWWGGAEFEARYLSKLESLPRLAKPKKDPLPAWKGAFKDLLSPWFLLSLAASCIYLWVSDRAVWIYLLRPLAIGYLVFWGIRSFPIAKFPRLQSVWENTERSRT